MSDLPWGGFVFAVWWFFFSCFMQFWWVVLEESEWVACRSCKSRRGHWIWGSLPYGFSERRYCIIPNFHTRFHQGKGSYWLISESMQIARITFKAPYIFIYAGDTRNGNRASCIHQLEVGGFQQPILQNRYCSATSSSEYSRDRSRKEPQTLQQANQPLSFVCFKYVFFQSLTQIFSQANKLIFGEISSFFF